MCCRYILLFPLFCNSTKHLRRHAWAVYDWKFLVINEWNYYACINSTIDEAVCLIGPLTAEALAQEVTQENFDKGLIYPPFTNIRKISAHIAAKVAAKAYELGICFPPLPLFFFSLFTATKFLSPGLLTYNLFLSFWVKVWRLVFLARKTWWSTRRVACTLRSTAATGKSLALNFVIDYKYRLFSSIIYAIVCCCFFKVV